MLSRLTLISTFCLATLLSPPLQGETYPSAPEQRNVSLQGTRNTRELGGLPVRGGVFAQGKVYRSGALCFASKADAEKFHKIGLKTIIELRLDNEIAKDGPDKVYLTNKVPHLFHWPMAGSKGPGLPAYQTYMAENGKLFRDFFSVLAKEENLPLLFHCSAGKDRTGILTALLLELMGTPRKVITDDYLHSMRITPKLKVERAWIDAVYAAVDADGGIEPFLRKRGVSEQQISAVRSNLTAERSKP